MPLPANARRKATAVLAAGMIAAGCSGANPGGERGDAFPAPAASSTASPTAPSMPTPTSTPAPTPTPLPPALSAATDGLGGLTALTLSAPIDAAVPGILIDGVLRAVAGATDGAVGSFWIPAGRHEVCITAIDPGDEPVRWEAPRPAATRNTAATACVTTAGAVDTPVTLFPDHRLVAHYGTGVSAALGVLGEGPPHRAVERVLDVVSRYQELDDREVLPAFEFVVTVATAAAGDDESHSLVRDQREVLPYLERIRAAGGVLVLDFQPGRADFVDQVRAFEELLREPDVHLALDPEWSMEPDQVPGRVIGSTDPEAVGAVMDWLGELVARHGLPEKLLILHQFTDSMIERREEIRPRPGIAVMYHIDGQGPVGAKYGTYAALHAEPPFHSGFKVFFDEDSRVLTPEEVLALDPPPDYISYQ